MTEIGPGPGCASAGKKTSMEREDNKEKGRQEKSVSTHRKGLPAKGKRDRRKSWEVNCR